MAAGNNQKNNEIPLSRFRLKANESHRVARCVCESGPRLTLETSAPGRVDSHHHPPSTAVIIIIIIITTGASSFVFVIALRCVSTSDSAGHRPRLISITVIDPPRLLQQIRLLDFVVALLHQIL